MSDSTQVLTFTLGEESYCVPIDYVAEIVDDETVQTVPNTEDHVEGVTDLRGETTTILDPSELLEVATDALLTGGGRTRKQIVGLDPDALGTESATGWLVSEVKEVSAVAHDALDTGTVSDSPFLEGFLKSDDDDEFTIWLDPHELTA